MSRHWCSASSRPVPGWRASFVGKRWSTSIPYSLERAVAAIRSQAAGCHPNQTIQPTGTASECPNFTISTSAVETRRDCHRSKVGSSPESNEHLGGFAVAEVPSHEAWVMGVWPIANVPDFVKHWQPVGPETLSW